MLSAEVGPGELTPLDQFIFESWGYFVIPDVLSTDEVAECYAASERMHAGREDHSFGQLGRGYESEPSLERLIDHPAVLPKIRGSLRGPLRAAGVLDHDAAGPRRYGPLAPGRLERL